MTTSGGDKVATANALSAAGVPQPSTVIAFTPESAIKAINDGASAYLEKPFEDIDAVEVKIKVCTRRTHDEEEAYNVCANFINKLVEVE